MENEIITHNYNNYNTNSVHVITTNISVNNVVL